jgi:hypothetical protein
MTDLDAAADFIWRHARLIDRHRFAHLFLGAGAEPVVCALRAYQNPDGGFGHALEPDIRTPTSQPGASMHVLEMLAETGAFDDPMVDEACDWLTTITRDDGGIPFVLPTAMEHPHAPWWQPADESSLLLTAAHAAVLHEQRREHPWLHGATAFCWERIDSDRVEGSYAARYAVAFLDAVPDEARAEAALHRIGPRLVEQGLVALDPAEVTGETFTPLDYSPRPDVRSRRMFEPEAIDAHLDALAAGQRDDGGWTFPWPAWCPAAELDWRGYVTIDALKVLRANGRLAPAAAAAAPPGPSCG